MPVNYKRFSVWYYIIGTIFRSIFHLPDKHADTSCRDDFLEDVAIGSAELETSRLPDDVEACGRIGCEAHKVISSVSGILVARLQG
jgi:hypothetical protein